MGITRKHNFGQRNKAYSLIGAVFERERNNVDLQHFFK